MTQQHNWRDKLLDIINQAPSNSAGQLQQGDLIIAWNCSSICLNRNRHSIYLVSPDLRKAVETRLAYLHGLELQACDDKRADKIMQILEGVKPS